MHLNQWEFLHPVPEAVAFYSLDAVTMCEFAAQ